MEKKVGVVHGPSPWGGNGMDPGPCFVYVPSSEQFNIMMQRTANENAAC